jgi:hypothetical protein
VFLFRHEEQPGCLPPRDDTGPVTFPDDQPQRKEAPR